MKHPSAKVPSINEQKKQTCSVEEFSVTFTSCTSNVPITYACTSIPVNHVLVSLYIQKQCLAIISDLFCHLTRTVFILIEYQHNINLKSIMIGGILRTTSSSPQKEKVFF